MKMLTNALITAVLFSLSGLVYAAPEPSDPSMQTPWKLYLDSSEAYEMKKEMGNKVLFVDVRDPIEIMFTGFTDIVDTNIPFKTADRTAWHKTKPVFSMETNPQFEQQIFAALEERGLSKETPILLMCRSGGTRGAPSAKQLWGKGYKNVYVVIDGFEGGTIKDGDKKNWRLKDGWKNSGLPWNYKLNKDKMYMPAEGS